MLQDSKVPWIDIAPKKVCKDRDHMQEFMQDIIDKGGEGIILRDPMSQYQAGRSAGYLKHKVCLLNKLVCILC
jgi:DNA ligase-1